MLVLGDLSVWNPTGEGCLELWVHLRLLFCKAVWHLTTLRGSCGAQFTPAQVIDHTAASFHRAISMDWLRISLGARDASELPAWCRLSDKRIRLELYVVRQRWMIRQACAGSAGAWWGLVHSGAH